MGWTTYNARCLKKDGSVDRKAECDRMWNENEGRTIVLKSAMVGTTYYAAVKDIKKNTVFAAIFLTSGNNEIESCNFGYKDMDETMEPCQCNCPKSILDLLSPTTNEYALNWRKSCYEKLKQIKLSDLAIGQKIRVKQQNGTEIILTKHEPAFQFHRPFWFNEKDRTYLTSEVINKLGFEIIKDTVPEKEENFLFAM